MVKRNAGAQSLVKVCRDGSARRAIAAALGVTEQAVRLWCEGRSAPNYANRKRIAEAYGIAIDSWDEAPRKRAA